ncbi:transposase [Parabacteroides sp. PF5-6]|uniref:transposase n=1 Tax=Parabacteroides sp. PF5-6 TaxID=1742403 RepID=UPI002405EF1A|nr:transposase [Parabacteroides sp. PF5-6]MDF9830426.1 putative transposase [Parabacteroides sp. PF5-6]
MNTKKRRPNTIRLNGYNYAQSGFYFVTICCQNKNPFFGRIEQGLMILNDAGEMIEQLWNELTNKYPILRLHSYVVMPDHFHGIIQICKDDVISLASIMDAFKSETTVRYISGVKQKGWPPFDKHLWQRNYYEHIIRDQRGFDNITAYIIENPQKWGINNEEGAHKGCPYEI